MILCNSVRRIGLFAGCMLVCTMFTAHAASTCEVAVASPSPAPMTCEASEGETTIVDAVVYEIVFAEVINGDVSDTTITESVPNNTRTVPRRARLIRKAISTSPSPYDGTKIVLDYLPELGSENFTGSFVCEVSYDATNVLLEALKNRDNVSILSSPQITTAIGTEAHVVMGYESQYLEIKILPILHEDGTIHTTVKWTESHDDKEKTHLLELPQIKFPTNAPLSLVMGSKRRGDTGHIFVVKTWKVQQTMPTKIACSKYDSE